MQQIKSAALALPPYYTFKTPHVRRLAGVIMSTPLTVTSEGPYSTISPVSLPQANSVPSKVGSSSAADVHFKESEPQVSVFDSAESEGTPPVSVPSASIGDHAAAEGGHGQIVLAISAYEDLVHVLKLSWVLPPNAVQFQWDMEMCCNEAALLLKIPPACGNVAPVPSTLSADHLVHPDKELPLSSLRCGASPSAKLPSRMQ